MVYLLIAVFTTIAIIVMAITGKMPTYHTAPAFLIPVVWGIFFLRRRLNLAPTHYVLIYSAILLHMSGAYGFYQQSPLPFSFDILVHYYFALVLALAVFRLLEGNFPALRPWHVYVITFFVMMGLAAMHEIMEYMSYLVLGEERGMLKPKIMYFFDTQRDLTNNLLGTLTALGGIWVVRGGRKPEHRQIA
jgi:uncharacterized membrane protein YjdF